MLETIFYNWKNILKIFLITIIAVTINIYINAKFLRNHIIDNWEYYRNKPYIIPFAGFIKKRKNESYIESTIHNLKNLVWLLISKFLQILVKPIYPVLTLITKVLRNFKDIIDNFRKQFKIMRNFLFTMVKKVYERLQGTVSAMTIFFLKLREGLKKQLGIYKMMTWTVGHSYYFLNSLLKGPVGNIGRFAETFGLSLSGFTLGAPGVFLWLGTVCFDPNTIITLKNTKKKALKNIELGEYLKDSSKVIGVLEFDISSSSINMFNYNDILVSGDHVVIEKNKKIRVQDSRLSKPIQYNNKKLNCLVTSSSLININNTIFSDYLDTHDLLINHDIHRTIEGYLNNGKYYGNSNIRNNDLMWGFGNKTLLEDGRRLDQLKIGDTLNQNKIRAIIKIDKKSITEYIYNGMYVSGNQLVKENEKWLRIYQSDLSVKKDSKNDYYINFCTDNNLININNIIYRDFIEVNDYIVNNVIDNNISLT